MNYKELSFKSIPYGNYGLPLKILSPNGFDWNPTFTIYRDNYGFNVGSWDISSYQPTGKPYYVSTTGNEANDGLTPGSPLKRVRTALAKADIKVCYIFPGVYPYYRSAGQAGGWDGYALQKGISIKRYGDTGQVILSLHEADLIWSLSGGYTYTYEAVRTTAITDVRDASLVDGNDGGYRNLIKQTSIANVEATAGSWYDDGSKIYVRTHDDRAPDANIRPYMGSIGNGYIAGHATNIVTCYLENIEFHGGTYGLRPTAIAGPKIPTVYLNNCAFKYSNSAGLLSWGAICYSEDCLAEYNNSDGFDYNTYNSAQSFASEINCIGRWNGYYNAQLTTNGSTAHDASRVVRVNGLYHHNRGPNIHDVELAKSWNLGVLAYDSIAGINPYQASFANGFNGVNITEMWFDHCISQNTGAQPDLYTDTLSISYLQSFSGNGFIGTGTLVSY